MLIQFDTTQLPTEDMATLRGWSDDWKKSREVALEFLTTNKLVDMPSSNDWCMCDDCWHKRNKLLELVGSLAGVIEERMDDVRNIITRNKS